MTIFDDVSCALDQAGYCLDERTMLAIKEACTPGAPAAQATVPGGGRDLAADIATARAAWVRLDPHPCTGEPAFIAAELTRLGWVHGGAGAGGARLSEAARETILGALESARLTAQYAGACPPSPQAEERMRRIAAARVEIEALPRVGVRT